MNQVNAKKILSVNLWYEKYSNKTNGQLKAFRQLGYTTHIATIQNRDKGLFLIISEITDLGTNTIEEKSFSSYKSAFKYLFSYCSKNEYSFIYIRRLMSKLLYAAPYFKVLSCKVPIVYEIPTYPLDTGNSILYKLRDQIEMSVYSYYSKYVSLTLANLIDNIPLKKGWEVFYNAIDMSDYELPPYPSLSDEIKLLIVANISEYHHYDRILDSMKKYIDSANEYRLSLTVISPESTAYNNFKEKANSLNLSECINCLRKKDSFEIREIAKSHHIGIGQLSTSEKGSNLVNTLKSKDYCAMGLPFVSTCYDSSFEKNFPYIYITENMDEDINLSDVIKWYLEIYKDSNYREKMYNYAKENLQYDKFALQIIRHF